MNKRFLAAALAGLMIFICGCSAEVPAPRVFQTIDEWVQQADDIIVTAHGAYGDGEADDSAAFQAALQQAQQDGKRVYVPAGRYKLNQPVTVPDGVCLVFGQGAALNQSATLTVKGAIAAPQTERIFSGNGKVELKKGSFANVCWFGAAGDGTTNDTRAFEKAFAAATEVRVPYTQGGYVVDELVTFRDWTLTGIEQDGKRPKLIATEDTYDMIRISDGGLPDGGHATVQNIDIDMAAAPDGSSAIRFNTKSGWLYDIYILNCSVTDAYYTFLDDKTTTTTNNRRAMFYVHIEDFVSKDNRHSTFEIVDFEGYVFFKNLTIDNANSFTKHNLTQGFPMINISNLAGNILQGVKLIGGNSGFTEEVGFYYPGCTSVWFDGLDIRDLSGYGMILDSYITSVSNCTINNCGGGIDLTGTDQMQMNKVTVNGRKDTAEPIDGILLKNVKHTQLTHVTSSGNSGNGIACYSSQVVMTDCTFTNNEQVGLVLKSGTDNKIINTVCINNKVGQINARSGRLIVQNVTVAEGQTPITETDVAQY